MNINNKIKQFFGGNWSCDKFTKEHTKVVPPVDVEEVKYKSNKKKIKKPYKYAGDLCTFCKIELPVDEEAMKLPQNAWRRGILEPKVDKCVNCGSYEVRECPACRRPTWYNPITGIYKHQNLGCGFIGKLLTKR